MFLLRYLHHTIGICEVFYQLIDSDLSDDVLFQLVEASTLKKEVAEGVDLMVVRELTGG